MSFASKLLTASMAMTLGLGAAAQGAIVDPATLAADSDATIAAIGQSLTGAPNSDFDNWANAELLEGANTGYGGFPGSGPWPGPIGSGTGGDAGLMKVANGAGGGAYPGDYSIYFGGFNDAGSFGGTLSVQEATPLTDLQTIAFQIEFGEAVGEDFFNGILPTLSINGGPAVAASYSFVTDQVNSGTFDVPGEGPQPLYINTYLLAWDLSATGLNVTDPVTDFSIDFSGAMHSSVYALRLDQSDAAIVIPTVDPVDPGASAVPEPASASLIALGGAALLLRRRRQSM